MQVNTSTGSVDMSGIFASFIEGYGSVVRLFAPTEQDDAENLRRDWIQVGNYIKHSIKELEGEAECGKPTRKEGRGEA